MMNLVSALGVFLTERRLLPDGWIRRGIRSLSRRRLEEVARIDKDALIEELSRDVLAPVPEKANEQHYEVPPEFFALCLGPHRKYSSCYFEEGVVDLGAAEARSLELSCEHAQLAGGQRILELGCGWGSLSLWMAEHYPEARITSVSNSHGQRAYIESQIAERGLTNLEVLTRDVNELELEGRFDRIVSIEMFEHLANHRALFERLDGWLEEDGKLFVHVFCHKDHVYRYRSEGGNDWLGRYFFTGGLMPSEDLFERCQDRLALEARQVWSGTHYQRTAEAWLANLDDHSDEALKILKRVYGEKEARLWLQRWRVFYMACAEFFGLEDGSQWRVAHSRFVKAR